MSFSKKRVLIIAIIVIVVIALVAVYLNFFVVKNCKDISCFDSYLVKCQKASYIDEKTDATWQYTILGKSNDKCIVNVLVLQLKQGTTNMASLEGKAMDCSLPMSTIVSPQSDLESCHGILKEEMQKLMITKLFNYITSNIGKLSEELTKLM